MCSVSNANINKGQSHLVLGGIVTNGEKEIVWGQIPVPVDRLLLLLSFYRLSTVTIPLNDLAAICNANFDWASDDPQISPYRGDRSNTMLFGTTWVSLPNGISFRPTALTGCTSVADDIQTDNHTDRQPRAVTCIAIRGIKFEASKFSGLEDMFQSMPKILKVTWPRPRPFGKNFV